MGSGRTEHESLLPGELVERHTVPFDLEGRLTELGAAPRPNLDLRRDQLADEMLLKLGAPRSRLQLLEAIDQPERVGIEQRELLLDREGEVAAVLEGIASRRELF